MLTYDSWSEDIVNSISVKDTMDCLKWAFEQYGDQIVYACSFGAESSVLLDLISKINKNASIAFIDTDLHFIETYEIIEKVKERYPTYNINFLKSQYTLEQQAEKYGKNLWESNPNLCCNVRKIEPLKKELSKYKAWITGLRRDQAPTRANVQYINKDKKFKLIKICPLIHWTWDDVWMYINLNKLPYHELHDKGYPSIGCEVCTKPVHSNEDLRAGRWQNHQKNECGLHFS
ncbi:phosphoadenylyl-sulfate reductase [Bacillus sp. Marseille-P3661]|uniref:phosphoadenylyl-sulfate reductase n=1 Tax=Bacillus sp. Marseille-P3661 TaxID=1936234 RepID=UPI0027E496D7|nr:phosphoadenylyl-sulfate reductase [Bacillus sp. Marseille-P3661]